MNLGNGSSDFHGNYYVGGFEDDKSVQLELIFRKFTKKEIPSKTR